MKVLVGATRFGPSAVFLPDGSHAAIGAHENLIQPLIAQAQARGTHASFEEHAKVLAAGHGYAGHWSVLDLPDGLTASQALYRARYRAAQENISAKG